MAVVCSLTSSAADNWQDCLKGNLLMLILLSGSFHFFCFSPGATHCTSHSVICCTFLLPNCTFVSSFSFSAFYLSVLGIRRTKVALFWWKGKFLARTFKPCWVCGTTTSDVTVLWQDRNAFIIRSHCSTTYVGAAYCYRPSSMVCRSVTVMSPAKMWTDRDAVWVEDLGGPRNHVLDGVKIPMGRGSFYGGRVAHCKV